MQEKVVQCKECKKRKTRECPLTESVPYFDDYTGNATGDYYYIYHDKGDNFFCADGKNK